MLKNNYLILSTNSYFKTKIYNKNFFFIEKKSSFNLRVLRKINPKIIFVPYWHWKIKKEILKKYLCIGFHTSPLPYGRGGSPIQNQILLNKRNSEICAIKYNNTIDGGEVYSRKKISLEGSANIIFEKIFFEIKGMIFKFIKKLPSPKKQKGKVVIFKRRKSAQSEIKDISKLRKLYNFIRMLDLDFNNFPKAYIINDYYKFIFSNVKFNKEYLDCNVKIIKKQKYLSLK